MKTILLVTYSQTGQTNDIAESLLSGMNSNIKVDRITIKPKVAFPFPWSGFEFFNAMPETVLEKTLEIEELPSNLQNKYDLILLGWQPWYLSVNRPILSFLKSNFAQSIFQNTPVVTFLGCRNMWVSGNEKMKGHLHNLQAIHVGQMALINKSSNLVSLVTILAWMLKGVKSNFMGIFPNAGIDESYFKKLPKFGEIISEHLFQENWVGMQKKLNEMGAMDVKPSLILMEKTGSKNFLKFARWIYQAPNLSERKKRVKFFSYLLPTAIVFLTPIISVLRPIQVMINRKKLADEKGYIQSVIFEKDRFHNRMR